MLRRWLLAGLAVGMIFAAPALALAHGFSIYCGLSAEPGTLVAGQGGNLDVHIYDPFGNGLPEAQVKVTASLQGQPEQVWQMKEQPDGHYVGPVRFPAPGSWQLRVEMISQAEPFHGVGSVEVVAPGLSSPGLQNAAVILVQDPAPGSLPTWLEMVAGVVLLLVPLALAFFWRRKPPDSASASRSS